MAYGVRYRINGKQMQTGTDIRVDICKENYTGSVTTIQGATDFIAFAWDPDLDTKYPIFKSSSADIFLMSPSRRYFLSLFTSRKFRYLVKYYVNSVQLWSGYLLADLYNEPYDYKNYFINIKAVDGLALLKNIPFTDEDDAAYSGRKTDLEIIQICLGKLNLGLGMYTAIDIYETTMTTGNAYDPLSQAYSPTEVFEGMDCAEVLREILKPYGAQIWQRNNNWEIVRASLLNGSSYIRRYYNSAGEYTAWDLHDPSQELTSDDAVITQRNILVQGSTNLQVIPAIKEFRINQDFGFIENALPGGTIDKKDFSISFPHYRSDYWRLYYDASTYVMAPGMIDLGDNIYVIRLTAPQVATANYPSLASHRAFYINSLSLVEDLGASIKVSFTFKINWTGGYIYSFRMFAHIYLGDYALTKNGWDLKTSLSDAEECVYFGTFDNDAGFFTYSVEASGIPVDAGSENLEIYLYQPIGRIEADTPVDVSLIVKEVKVTLGSGTEIITSDYQLLTKIDDDNNYIPEDIDVLLADIPDMPNNDKIYKNGKFLADGTPTRLWQVPGSVYQEQLIIALARMITDQYMIPTIMYEGLVEDVNLNIGSVITDPWDDIKLYVHQISSYNPLSMKAQVRLVEISDGESLVTISDNQLVTLSGEKLVRKVS